MKAWKQPLESRFRKKNGDSYGEHDVCAYRPLNRSRCGFDVALLQHDDGSGGRSARQTPSLPRQNICLRSAQAPTRKLIEMPSSGGNCILTNTSPEGKRPTGSNPCWACWHRPTRYVRPSCLVLSGRFLEDELNGVLAIPSYARVASLHVLSAC
jgi:hypothetical protein